MCTVAIISSPPCIQVALTLDEARRIGDLNIDLSEIEIIRWRRKVRDALKAPPTPDAFKAGPTSDAFKAGRCHDPR